MREGYDDMALRHRTVFGPGGQSPAQKRQRGSLIMTWDQVLP